jgi:uncharacterized protein YndB with AHSA1/START domain
MEDRIERSVDLKAPVERVWNALADPRQFGSWFRVKIDTPFVPGQPASGYITYPGYEHIRWEVMIQRMEEPRLFSFTCHPFAIEPGVDYSKEEPTLVEFRLEPLDGGTRLTVTESGFSKLPAHRYSDAIRSNTGGWEAQMENIKAHVEP